MLPTQLQESGNDASYVEKQESRSIETNVVDVDKTQTQFPNVNERKLMMKIDFKVISSVFVLSMLTLLDRVNIANAAIFGLKTDLNLVGNQYNSALLIFFVPYILFEIPSNLMMKRFRPHIWLPLCTLLIGMITCLQGTVTSYSGLLATRFFIGLCEANIFPGCFYLISMWYRRDEAQKRFTLLYSSSTISGAFGGLFASAIGKMGGIGGYKAWRWVFIIEGLLTCVVSVILYFVMSGFPEDATWLSIEEKDFVKQRLYNDVGDSKRDTKIGFKNVLNVLKDYKVIAGGFIYFGLVVPAYCYAYFAPTIIQGFGHSSIQTQLYSVPPSMAGFVFSMIIAVISDYMKRRFIFYLISIAVSLTGLIILIIVHNMTHLQYAALFLVASGTSSALAMTICWFASNLGGHERRSIGSAWQIGFGNIGGIIATFSFLSKDAPKYITGYSICLGFTCLSVLASLVYFFGIVAENKRRDRGDADSVDMSVDEKGLMGDLNPDYRYML